MPHRSKTSSSPRYRKHLRLRDHDYRENGYYFVTVCTKDRKPYFVSEEDNALVQEKIDQIPTYFLGVRIDLAVVMPNHLHVILFFQSSDKSLGQVMQAFKSWVTRAWGLGWSVWQPNYYEHVIRNEQALHKIREYIVNNPVIDQVDCEQFYEL